MYEVSKFRMKVLQLVVNFAGNQATKECSRCKKVLPGAVGCKDYSGFDRSQWEPRNTEKHRDEMLLINSCSTKGEKEQIETLYGTRFTPLVCIYSLTTIRLVWLLLTQCIIFLLVNMNVIHFHNFWNFNSHM